MFIIDCKECGGRNEFAEGASYITCAYCGKQITVPSVKDAERVRLFNRANEFRRQGEFDKAIRAFSGIAEQDASDPEATWGIVLSKYGIEYVEDPRTGERIPTCNRVSTESILTDSDYLATLENSRDEYSKSLYIKEAKQIDKTQKGILAIAKQEDPFDVFICYKETTGGGSRTQDSVIAQDIYEKLNREELHVFFSRITLEEKLGHQYEPYIYAALSTARVMLVVATSSANVNSPWVKNEWSRFLSITRMDHEKTIIPCYYKMDIYDLPEELNIYQCQDMSKIGAMQDLVRGVMKICSKKSKAASYHESAQENTTALLDRGYICLHDSDFTKADQLFEQVLNHNPHSAKAYLGKLMAERQVSIEENLRNESVLLERSNNFNHIFEYGDVVLKGQVLSYARDVAKTVKKNLIVLIKKEANLLLSNFDKEYDHLNEQLLRCEEEMGNAEDEIEIAEKGIKATKQRYRKNTNGYIKATIVVMLWILFSVIVMGSDNNALPPILRSDGLHMVMGLSFFPCVGFLLVETFSFITMSGKLKRDKDKEISKQTEKQKYIYSDIESKKLEIKKIKKSIATNRKQKEATRLQWEELLIQANNARHEELRAIEDKVNNAIPRSDW